MRLQRFIPVILAGSLAFGAGALRAQDTNNAVPARTPRVVSLTDCIQLALQNNFDIQIQRYNPVISGYTLAAQYGGYEPTFTFTANKTYNQSAGSLQVVDTNGVPTIVAGSQREARNYSPEIKGVLPTGLTYDVSGTMSRNNIWSTNGGGYWEPPTWSSAPGITLAQPLLKNFWIDQTRLNIQLDKVALRLSEQALRLQVMASVTSVKSAYYNLLYARGNVEANAKALELANELAAENKKKVEIGTLAPLDEKQAESQAAASRAALQAAEQALVTQENTLKNLLTSNYVEWAGVAPVPSEALVAVPQPLDLQESWRRALTGRPELLEAQLKLKQQNITLKFNYNQLFPQLDLTGSYGRNAFGTDFNANIDQLQHGDSPFYSFGAIFSIPLGGSVTARNTYKSGKATLRQVLLQLKQEEQSIMVQIDNDVGQVRSSLAQVNSTHEARLYAEDALAAEQKKLENGKSTSFNVLQLISNLTTARVNEIQALANYNVAQAQLSLDEGATLEENQIDFRVK
jgi:outer membrane protein